MFADLVYVAAPRDDVVEIAHLLGGHGGRPVGHVLLASKPWTCLVVGGGAGPSVAAGVARLSGKQVYLIEARDDSCRVAWFDRDGSPGPAVEGHDLRQIETFASALTGVRAERLDEAFGSPPGADRLRAVAEALSLDDPTDALLHPPAGFLLLDAPVGVVRERFRSADHGVVLVPAGDRTVVVSDGTGPAPGPFALATYTIAGDSALRGRMVMTGPGEPIVLSIPDEQAAPPTARAVQAAGSAARPAATTSSVLDEAGLPALPVETTTAAVSAWAAGLPGAEAISARRGSPPVVDVDGARETFRLRRRVRRIQLGFVALAVSTLR